MTAIPHAALALTSALGRFDRASLRTVEAATGVGEPEAALVDLIEAKTQVKASVAVVRFADEMWKALLALPERRSAR
ncbi:MAG: hypothetical protein JNM59_09110 [Hyphomonadaceae bacterium]|nr:hypothetical protein [Hyphomonadaceae bacterium]